MFEKEFNLDFDAIRGILEEKYQIEGLHFDWDDKKLLLCKDDNDNVDMYKKYIKQLLGEIF